VKITWEGDLSSAKKGEKKSEVFVIIWIYFGFVLGHTWEEGRGHLLQKELRGIIVLLGSRIGSRASLRGS